MYNYISMDTYIIYNIYVYNGIHKMRPSNESNANITLCDGKNEKIHSANHEKITCMSLGERKVIWRIIR